MSETTRRAVLGAIAAALAPGAARAQPRGGVRRLGVLSGSLATDRDEGARAAVLAQALGQLGWTEGGTLRIDWRWAGGDPALYERYAAELVALAPDVLVAFASRGVRELHRRTSTIPIVFVNVTDPVGQGFVASLARPGGTITGFSDYDPPMSGKWLDLLSQLTPRVARVAVLYNPATAPYADGMMHAVAQVASSFAGTVRGAPYRTAAELAATMAGLAREERGGMLVLPDSFATLHREAIVAGAARHRLPAVYSDRAFIAIGGLMSYGVDRDVLIRRSAGYVDRILRGAKPADLPVQAPTKFELAINLKTAKTLGVAVAPALLATADSVIE